MTPKKILVFHTAFIGDIVLTLPTVQQLRTSFPDASISFVAIPSAATILQNHPAITEVIVYDKRGSDAGIPGIRRLVKRLRNECFDVAVIPHRSLRSAVIGWMSRIPKRIGFASSAGAWLFTDIVRYDKDIHEIDRNLSLLKPLDISSSEGDLPKLYPDEADRRTVDSLIDQRILQHGKLIGIAPGSVWNTKRWIKGHFITLGNMLMQGGFSLALIGGKEDVDLCNEISSGIGTSGVLNAAGRLTLLQSAELIRRCIALVSNDSAPMHLAVAMRTPVIAIFGATVPQFGFAPRGEHDVVVETPGLPCRPCSIHGGEACPIKTFVCMNEVKPEQVFTTVQAVIDSLRSEML